jgi:two-component system chemotaxis response regulator CheB
LQRGSVMLAASNQSHLVVVAGPHGLQARLRNTPPAAGHRPSVDVLFQSVADAVPGGAVGVLLSGMGCDGARGLLAMRQAGCPTIAQDEATATVFGMPRAAAEVGAAQFVLPLDRIARQALLACAA